MWNVDTGELARTFDGAFQAAAFSPDGKLFAAGGARAVTPSVSMWDARTGEPESRLVARELRQEAPRWGQGIWSLAFSPDSKQLAAALGDTTVRLWNLETKMETILAGHSDEVRSVVFLPDGHTLATGGRDRAVQLWELKSLSIRKTLVGRRGLQCLAASPDGKLLASGGSDGRVVLWDIGGAPATQSSAWEHGAVLDFLMSPGNGPLVILKEGPARTRYVKSWDFRKNAATTGELSMNRKPSRMAMSRDGVLAVLCEDGRAHLWNVSDRTPRDIVELGAGVSSIALSGNGARLVAVEPDGAVAVWETWPSSKLGLLRRIRKPSGRITKVALSPDGTICATSDESRVDLRNVNTGQVVCGFSAPRGTQQLAFSPDGSVLASADPFVIRLLDLAASEGARPEVLPAHSSYYVTSLNLSSDGRTLVSAANDMRIRFWDVPTRRMRFELHVPEVGFLHTELSADQSALVARRSRGLRIWRAERRTRVLESALIAHQETPEYDQRLDTIVKSRRREVLGSSLAGAGKLAEAEEEYDRALELSPNDGITLRLRGNVRARAGRWAEALADYSRAAERQPGGYAALWNHAALLLHGGDRDRYRRVCGELVDQFADSQRFDPTPCLILPGVMGNPDVCVQGARRRAEQAEEGAADKPSKLFTKALAEYRVAEFVQAMDDLAKMREGLRALRKPSMCDESRGCLLAAMASWQLNRKEAAREWLSKGQEIIQNKFPKEGKDDIKEWPAWIHCQALLREAKELIREASAR